MMNAEFGMGNEEAKRDLRARTKQFALRVIKMYVALRRNEIARVLGHQAVRSGTSVGAHYREACRARSVAEFISKLEGGLQELDETSYWLELLVESGQVKKTRLEDLQHEANELTAILASSAITAKKSRRR
ncbi:MAG TPA: four helix bundle protein [Tepidisphaeraceae bacterium]|jgi:four helix bundle protein